jgi:hypothetical protein
MRRILTAFAVAAFVAVVPRLALAGNQEMAQQIANKLHDSGQLSHYKIGVKFQDGTAWLHGRVTDQQQMKAALRLAFQTPGVRRVVNGLATDSDDAGAVAQTAPQPQRSSLMKRFEGAVSGQAAPRAERVSTSYAATPARTVSAEEYEAEAPQPMASQARARPMAVNRMAMQNEVRGPVAPNGGPLPMYTAAANASGVAPARYDQPSLPNYAWPSYAAYPNYAAVTYPKQYSPTAWPYIGPFYPYPQVPMGWRKVTLEWDDGWWFLDFKDQPASCWHR